MAALSFTVPAVPVPMGRPRVTVRAGMPHGYVPAKTAHAAWEIRQAATAALGNRAQFTGPVMLRVIAYVPVPKSLPKRLHGLARPVKRPDVDHFGQLAMDGCSPLWLDDSQVVDLRVAKCYAWDRPPMWKIEVESA